MDRKVLIIAMEEGSVAELLPASFVVTESGRRQDFPALDLPTARSALTRLLAQGLVGTYVLDSDDEYVGDAAISSVQSDQVWTTPGSDELCLFLTSTGEHVVGIGDVRAPSRST